MEVPSLQCKWKMNMEVFQPVTGNTLQTYGIMCNNIWVKKLCYLLLMEMGMDICNVEKCQEFMLQWISDLVI